MAASVATAAAPQSPAPPPPMDWRTGEDESQLSHEDISKLKVRFIEKNFAWFQEETSRQRGRTFKPRPSDVFIATYPKCGTTWVSQICHQLRTGGHTDFEEITEIVPWDIHALTCGQDLDGDQVAEPRLFKSHESYYDIAKGGKYIHVCRNPEDAFLSYYRFLPGNNGFSFGEISFEDYLEADVHFGADLFDFFVSFWERRNDPNVLWVAYEDLRKDLPSQVRRIADFMDIELTTQLLETVLELSSFKWMEAHSHQFDEHYLVQKKGIVKTCEGVSKVRKGGGAAGEGKAVLTEEFKQILQRKWDEKVFPRTGLATYSDMLEKIREHQLTSNAKEQAPAEPTKKSTLKAIIPDSVPPLSSNDHPTLLRSCSRQEPSIGEGDANPAAAGAEKVEKVPTATGPEGAGVVAQAA